jgi:23S rRNA (guanine2445-N2)-methyltransferase / 23S rRNA (guanine2069-N7)-methyltransferase
MPSTARESFFVTCAPGLEPVLHEEMKALKLAKVERQVSGAYFEGTLRDAMRANLWLRTAVRVLMRVARFPAANADELYAGAHEVEWSRFIEPTGSLVVDAHSTSSALDHTLFIAQRVKDAVVDALRDAQGVRPKVAKTGADLGVYAHLFKDRCTLLVDTSGESLHKRGWRRFQGRAPLAETLAAGLVLASQWDRRAPLIDPFCGSGTILIEAALLADNIAPGSFRASFGFERWKEHDAATWERVKAEAREMAQPARKTVLLGFDRDPAAVAGANDNIAAAGLSGRIEIARGEALDFAPRKNWNAWVVSNPPYGERLGDERKVRELYQRFGARLREHCAGFHVALLCPATGAAKALGLVDAQHTRIQNGGIECDMLTAAL